MFPDDFEAEYTDQLTTIQIGTVLYDVYVLASPDDSEVKIGSLRTTSPFVTSNWGDEKLFFQHNLMDLDLDVHPEWVKKSPSFSIFN